MKHLTTLISALFISFSVNAANVFSDVIDYTVASEDLFESPSEIVGYNLKYTKSGRILNFTKANKDGIATLTAKELYLNSIEIKWASTATEGQIMAIYNADLSGGLDNLYNDNRTGDVWAKIACEGPGTTTTFVAAEMCTDFGLKPSTKEAAISSITITWSDEAPSTQTPEPDVDRIDFKSDDFSDNYGKTLTGEFFTDSRILLSISDSYNASLTDNGLNLYGSLTVNAIDGYIIKNIDVNQGEVELIDDWSALIYSGNEEITIAEISVKLGYETPKSTSQNGQISVPEFPAEIVLTHAGSEARIFYIFEEAQSVNKVVRHNAAHRLPEQTPENWTEAENGKITIDKAGTLHCYAANADHSILSDIKSETIDITTGIDSVSLSSDVTAEYYSLQGVCIGSDFNKLSKGIYICRRGETVTKIIKQ